MAEKRVSKHWSSSGIEPITIEDINTYEVTPKNLIQTLLSIKESDVNFDLMMNMFGHFEGKSLCNVYDTFDVPIGAWKFKDKDGKEKSNKNKFTTTIGIWMFNLYFFRDDGLSFLFGGYMNENIAKKQYGKINTTLSYALLEDKITIDQLKRYLNKTQWIMPFETILMPNYSEGLLNCTKEINKKKEELYKKYKKDIDAGKVDVAEKMENELLDYAKELLKDDPGMDMFLSGGGGNISNNFKNIYVMKGAMRDPDPNAMKQYNIAMSNYSDGISKDEYKLFANALAAGPYARGKKTETGGYWEKLFVSGYQHIDFETDGSDCGTNRHIVVTLTDDMLDICMYSYIIEGSKLVELTSDNRDKYKDKTVKMRFASMCTRPHGKGRICNKCAGNAFARIGLHNGGIATSQVMSRLKNVCMKAFHDGTIKTVEIDPMKAFSLK